MMPLKDRHGSEKRFKKNNWKRQLPIEHKEEIQVISREAYEQHSNNN